MRERQVWLDTWRGMAVVHMAAYHMLWDLVYLFGWQIPWFETSIAFYWEQWIAWSFILVSGICAVQSRHLLRRGLELFGLGALITAVTLWVGGDSVIYFGILTLLGSAMIFSALAKPWLHSLPAESGLLIAGGLFCLTYAVPKGYLGVPPFSVSLPVTLYDGLLSSFVGFKAEDFYSADYFPLLPWLFLYLVGYMGGRLLENGRMRSPFSIKEPFFSAIGRRALPIYLLHQPLIIGGLMAASFFQME